MGRERRSTRVRCQILLIAMAIQGLTPDHFDLASPWLLRLVTSEPVDGGTAGSGPAPTSLPIPGGQDGGVPGAICATSTLDLVTRDRLDPDGRPCLHGQPSPFLGWWRRSTSPACRLPGLSPRGSEGLIPALCRFLC